MNQFDWDPDKNQRLIKERGISFEEVVFYLQSDALIDDIAHPNQKDYAHQRVLVIAIDSYAYLVPYVQADSTVFLNTIIPSR